MKEEEEEFTFRQETPDLEITDDLLELLKNLLKIGKKIKITISKLIEDEDGNSWRIELKKEEIYQKVNLRISYASIREEKDKKIAENFIKENALGSLKNAVVFTLAQLKEILLEKIDTQKNLNELQEEFSYKTGYIKSLYSLYSEDIATYMLRKAINKKYPDLPNIARLLELYGSKSEKLKIKGEKFFLLDYFPQVVDSTFKNVESKLTNN